MKYKGKGRGNMNTKIKAMTCAFGLCALPAVTQAAIIDFHFTGNLMVAGPGPSGSIINNGEDASGIPIPLTPISATLSYNTVTGIGGSDMSIVMSGGFWSSPATFHDISLQYDGGTTINGNILVDWNGTSNMPMHINWDASGLLNAIDIGLNVGDTISGTTLKQDTTGDGNFDTFTDVFSASPHSDYLMSVSSYSSFYADEGPAPLAATASSLGLGYDINGVYIGGTPFDGIKGLINIGSGNSLTVTSYSVVPVPAAVWLFGTGLLTLIGMSRRRINEQ
jgi:hypothetical protein